MDRPCAVCMCCVLCTQDIQSHLLCVCACVRARACVRACYLYFIIWDDSGVDRGRPRTPVIKQGRGFSDLRPTGVQGFE